MASGVPAVVLAATPSPALQFVRDVGAVLVAWGAFVVAEFVVVAATCRGLFAGNWELLLARRLVGPIAFGMLLPAAPLVVAVGHLVARSARPSARAAVAALAASTTGLVAVGVTHGRHFASVAVRVPFVAVAVVVAAGVTYALAPRVARMFAGRWRGAIALGVGVAGAALFWWVDAHVLPRLYPAFHALAVALSLSFAALSTVAWRSSLARPVSSAPSAELALASLALAAAVAAAAFAPSAARGLARADNLRFVLDQNAPLLGRAVHVAAWLSPPPPLEDGDSSAVGPTALEVPRALDWAGADILLVSIDALRADHVGAYGYARSITPNLDALARSGAVFEHAYCPTPHTSYSVTSMMTGKAMRPLLSLGLGKDSETWATLLRRYGYKTAGFYPPAVFYIDQDRFEPFEKGGLGFEYRWVEFTSAEAKVEEVKRYLATAGGEPLFVWVHLFEPHEPYIVHRGYEMARGGEGRDGDGRAVDAYDSEVAYADAAVGALVAAVRAARAGHPLAVIATADHGEEFGEHGGRYHGTTCYEEQVRVPLVVAAPGVAPGKRATVVQTIDLLPTVLSAIGIPRPARLEGRDLGEVLAHARSADGAGADEPGQAYAETDDQTLLARGDARLICARKIAACALYDLAHDPSERVDVAPAQPDLARELRALSARVEKEHGKYEAAEVAWPEVLRRGMQGDADAAADVAVLLDDANVVIRRKAAEVCYRLAVPDVAPELGRALAHDEDEEVRRWVALALVRLGQPRGGAPEALLGDADPAWRRRAALAFAERGDGRGRAELAAWWRDEGPSSIAGSPKLDTADAKELLAAIARIRDRDAVPALVDSLQYVPLRPSIATALGAIGDPRAEAPLLALLKAERYEAARLAEASALVALGAGPSLRAPLTMFAGIPDPMVEAVDVARRAGLLEPAHGGAVFDPPVAAVDVTVAAGSAEGALRVWFVIGGREAALSGWLDTERVAAAGPERHVDVRPAAHGPRVRVQLHDASGIQAVWVVPVLAEVPPVLAPRVPDAG